MNDKITTWNSLDGKEYMIREMSLNHLENTVDMLARKQLGRYTQLRQDYIEVLQEELDRRKFKQLTKGLF